MSFTSTCSVIWLASGGGFCLLLFVGQLYLPVISMPRNMIYTRRPFEKQNWHRNFNWLPISCFGLWSCKYEHVCIIDWRRCSYKFRKFHRKTLLLDVSWKPTTLSKRDSNRGFFQWNLRNFQEYLFWRTSVNDCCYIERTREHITMKSRKCCHQIQ